MAFRNEVAGAGRFYADRKVEALLLGEARRRAVTRMFGIPGEEQSLLVTMILAGSAATALGGLLARPLPHPSGTDVAMGGAVVNAAFGAMTGATRTAPVSLVLVSRTIPLILRSLAALTHFAASLSVALQGQMAARRVTHRPMTPWISSFATVRRQA